MRISTRRSPVPCIANHLAVPRFSLTRIILVLVLLIATIHLILDLLGIPSFLSPDTTTNALVLSLVRGGSSTAATPVDGEASATFTTNTTSSSSSSSPTTTTTEKDNDCLDPHVAPDGGDCQALQGQNRRPIWACFSKMRQELPTFWKLYQQRPIPNNQGGMMFDHSFALYYTLKQVRPEIVIESGAFKGHSTWLIRQALPHARIISLDPVEPAKRLDGVEYMIGKQWIDIAKVDWKHDKGVDPTKALLFIDDHQSGYRRALLEMMPQGFSRFILEDNYPFLAGDNMSFKWVCELERKSEWPGAVRDNFAKRKIP